MGGFPSHDAAGFLYSTVVQHPSSSLTIEICLVPLLRRYFNDNNYKLKDALAQICFNGPPNTTQIAVAAMQQGYTGCSTANPTTNSPATTSPSTPVAIGEVVGKALDGSGRPGVASAAGPHPTGHVGEEELRVQQAVTAYKAIEHLLNEVEASFYTSTNCIYEAAAAAKRRMAVVQATRDEKRRAEKIAAGRGASMEEATNQTDSESDSTDPEQMDSSSNSVHQSIETVKGPAADAAKRTGPHTFNTSMIGNQWPILRPVPCVVCVVEHDTGGRKGSGHSSGGSQGGGYTINGVALTDWVGVHGRKLHCIGYLSCFSDVYPLTAPTVRNGGPSADRTAHDKMVALSHLVSGTATCASVHPSLCREGGVPLASISSNTGLQDEGRDVYLELVLRHETAFRYLIEPIMFLASITFRSQYTNSSMWQRPLGSKEVEEDFYNHLQLLNLHIMLNRESYVPLRLFHDQFPLIEHADEMGVNERHAARVAGVLNGTGTTQTACDKTPPSGLEDANKSKGGRCRDSSMVLTSKEDDEGDADDTTQVGDEKNALSTDGDMTTSRRTRRSRRRHKKSRGSAVQDEVYRQTLCQMPKFMFYEVHTGEYGVEVVIDGGVLARFMKFVTDTASFEMVRGSYVRCDLGPLMKERRHLQQVHREAMVGGMHDEGEDNRLYGNELIATAIRAWLKQGAAAEERLTQANIRALAQRAEATASQQATPPVGYQAASYPQMVPQPMMMYMPGVGYIAAPAHGHPGAVPSGGQMVMMPHPASSVQATGGAQSYVFNSATGQMQLVMPPQPASTSVPYSVMTIPQQAQPYYMPAAPAFMQQPAPMQYHYVMGPNGQPVLMPVMTAQPQVAAPHVVQQPYYQNVMYAPQGIQHASVAVGGMQQAMPGGTQQQQHTQPHLMAASKQPNSNTSHSSAPSSTQALNANPANAPQHAADTPRTTRPHSGSSASSAVGSHFQDPVGHLMPGAAFNSHPAHQMPSRIGICASPFACDSEDDEDHVFAAATAAVAALGSSELADDGEGLNTTGYSNSHFFFSPE